MELYDCAVCAEETVVEQPPCADGHAEDGLDCPEWVCTGCGEALLLGAPGAATLWQQAA